MSDEPEYRQVSMTSPFFSSGTVSIDNGDDPDEHIAVLIFDDGDDRKALAEYDDPDYLMGIAVSVVDTARRLTRLMGDTLEPDDLEGLLDLSEDEVARLRVADLTRPPGFDEALSRLLGET